ncbi:MAG: methylmalonyl-CoA mutase family protein [Nocardioides sp.]
MTDQGTVEGGLDEPDELEPEQGSLDLADPDDQYSREDWERAAAGVLRKARRLGDDDPDGQVWAELALTTLDGIQISPLGTADLLDQLATSGRPDRAGEWDIRAHLGTLESKAANQAALVDLDNGVTSLWVEVTPETDLVTLLDGVLLDLAPVVLDAPDDQAEAARALLGLLGDTIPADGTNLGGHGDSLLEVARLARDAGTLGVVVDATGVHDRGASDVQELAWSLATGAAYLRELTADGFEIDEALALVEFRYAATDEQFATIAKLRAARRLWSRVAELSGASPEAGRQRQHVVTSRPMMAKYDPWVNMLRTTVAAFAAGVGGADAITVLPFDSALGVPDAFGRRIARNTGSLLISESHVARVADPAGGSYAVEKLTDDLALAAWAELGVIEESGFDALEDRIAALADRREDQIAHRSRPLTGVTEFPHLGEPLPDRTAPPAGSRTVRSYAASFEALRDEPAAQPVFLATMGTIAAHTARATFATNLFAAGGFGVQVAGATGGVDDVVAAYDGQQVVCLAGADGAYAEWGAEVVAALREAGARHVILAGKPREIEVDDACAVGDDALDFLRRTREQLR